MASIGIPARRWTLAGLLRRLHTTPRIAAADLTVDNTAAAAGRRQAKKRFYPPQREGIFERSAMAREMYRL